MCSSSALTAMVSLGYLKIRGSQGNITEAECCWHIHFWQEMSEMLHYPRGRSSELTVPELGSCADFRLVLCILRAQCVSALALQVAKKQQRNKKQTKTFKYFLPHIFSHESIVDPLVWPSLRRSFCWPGRHCWGRAVQGGKDWYLLASCGKNCHHAAKKPWSATSRGKTHQWW